MTGSGVDVRPLDAARVNRLIDRVVPSVAGYRNSPICAWGVNKFRVRFTEFGHMNHSQLKK